MCLVCEGDSSYERDFPPNFVVVEYVFPIEEVAFWIGMRRKGKSEKKKFWPVLQQGQPPAALPDMERPDAHQKIPALADAEPDAGDVGEESEGLSEEEQIASDREEPHSNDSDDSEGWVAAFAENLEIQDEAQVENQPQDDEGDQVAQSNFVHNAGTAAASSSLAEDPRFFLCVVRVSHCHRSVVGLGCVSGGGRGWYTCVCSSGPEFSTPITEWSGQSWPTCFHQTARIVE